MKKIINGKKYDTETAGLICEHDNGRSWTDFYFYKECLYKKKTGEFFIHEEGGLLRVLRKCTRDILVGVVV